MMFQDINEQIAQAQDLVRQKRKTETQLEDCRRALQAEEEKLAKLQAGLVEAENEVENFHGLSLTHLFLICLGKQDEHQQKLQQDVVKAKLQYDLSRSTIQTLQKEIDALNHRLFSELFDAEEQFQTLMAQKEKIIAGTDTPLAQQLAELELRDASLRMQLKEVSEAVSAGVPAVRALEACQASLGSARAFGTWDMLGGGLLVTAMKRDHMHEATEHAKWAQQCLNKLNRELRDLHQFVDVNMSSGFTEFADYFFDGLFVDWYVQTEITEAHDRVSTRLMIVKDIFQQLRNQEQKLTQQHEQIALEHKRLVESAE